jgi:hypothetical protein
MDIEKKVILYNATPKPRQDNVAKVEVNISLPFKVLHRSLLLLKLAIRVECLEEFDELNV